MLQFKIKELLLATGKQNPATWLIKHCSISRTKAYAIIKGKQDMISRHDLSALCKALTCTPNDLMYWQNKPGSELSPNHPCITQLTPPQGLGGITKLLEHFEPQKAAEIYANIETLVQAEIAKHNTPNT
ncbi:MAG: helix-turn-helix transcriptional regulator [Bacteroidota bacterium]